MLRLYLKLQTNVFNYCKKIKFLTAYLATLHTTLNRHLD
jgi:hypothetical protein